MIVVTSSCLPGAVALAQPERLLVQGQLVRSQSGPFLVVRAKHESCVFEYLLAAGVGVERPRRLVGRERLGVLAHEAGHIAGGHLAKMRQEMANAQTQMILATVLGLGIAYHAKPAVAAAAHGRIDHGDLTALLYAQGYRREEFVVD